MAWDNNKIEILKKAPLVLEGLLGHMEKRID